MKGDDLTAGWMKLAEDIDLASRLQEHDPRCLEKILCAFGRGLMELLLRRFESRCVKKI